MGSSAGREPCDSRRYPQRLLPDGGDEMGSGSGRNRSKSCIVVRSPSGCGLSRFTYSLPNCIVVALPLLCSPYCAPVQGRPIRDVLQITPELHAASLQALNPARGGRPGHHRLSKRQRKSRARCSAWPPNSRVLATKCSSRSCYFLDPGHRFGVRGQVPGRPSASPCSAPGRVCSHATRRVSPSAGVRSGCSRQIRWRISASPVAYISSARRMRSATAASSCDVFAMAR